MRIRRLLMALSVALIAPVYFSAGAAAVEIDQNSLDCYVWTGNEFPVQQLVTRGCDLAIDKQVSVNGGAYADADSDAAAVTAQIGDTITWKITVTDTSSQGLTHRGIVRILDTLPTNVSFNSYSLSAGTWASDTWTLPLIGNDDGSNLPATLTLVTTASSAGKVKNTAVLNDFDQCIDGCLGFNGYYADADSSNNTNDAWVNIQTKPQVLGESTTAQVLGATTLVNTGSNNILPNAFAGLLVLGTFGLGFATRGRRFSIKK